MSTPESESPRLPDDERSAEGDQPDLERQNKVEHAARVSDDEKEVRIPDPDE